MRTADMFGLSGCLTVGLMLIFAFEPPAVSGSWMGAIIGLACVGLYLVGLAVAEAKSHRPVVDFAPVAPPSDALLRTTTSSVMEIVSSTDEGLKLRLLDRVTGLRFTVVLTDEVRMWLVEELAKHAPPERPVH